jgi:hypothetical protein
MLGTPALLSPKLKLQYPRYLTAHRHGKSECPLQFIEALRFHSIE